MAATYHLDRDLEEARLMADALEEYVRGDVLYGSIGGMYAGDPDLPSVTVGNLLTRLRRLKALESQMSAQQRALLTAAEAEHARVRDEWTVHYIGKAANEAGARLRSIEAFIADCDDAPEACASNYLPEAQRRTVVQEIVDGLQGQQLPDSGLDRTLKQVDGQLRRLSEPSEFIWDSVLKPVYPQAKFWWLYQRPSGKARSEGDA